MTAQARVREDLEPNGYDWIFALRAAGVGALAENGALQPTLFDERDMAEIECRELFPGERLVVCRNPLLAEERTRKREELIAAAAADLMEIRRAVRRDKRPLRSADAIRRRAERALDKRKMRKHFDLRIGTGSFFWKRKKQAVADEAALGGFYVVRTNVPEERMSAAVVETCKRLGRVERAFRTMKASDLQVRPIRHRLEPRVRAHLLICMLAYYVEKHMREALAPMLFDDEHGPVRDSPVAKAERSPQARRKAASKRTSSGEDVHDFRGLLEQLGTLTMNRIEPSGPRKPGFDVPASPTPVQDRALRLLNAKQLYLAVVEIRVELRRERVVEGSCRFCLFGAAPGPIRPLPMMNPDIVPDFCLFGSFARFSFAAARRAWKVCGQSLFALRSGFAFGARIDHASHTLRCRRPVPVRRFPFRNSPAGLFHIGFFLVRAVEMWTILSGAFGRASVRAWIAHIPTAPSGRGARAAIRHPVCGAQGWRDLHKALAITTSLRATAAATTLCGLPSFRSRSANSFKSLL